MNNVTKRNTKHIVLFYWDKSTWYAYGALAASLSKFGIPYDFIKGDSLSKVNKWLSLEYRVIYAESSRNMSLQSLITRLKTMRKSYSITEVVNVVGGPQASGAPLHLLTNGADYVVIGEGEVTFPSLIQSLMKVKYPSIKPHNIPGIAFLDEQKNLVITPKRAKIDLDKYCPYSAEAEFPLHPPIEIMRGCAFRCRFCQVPYLYGNPRYRSISTIIKIVEHYYRYFHPLKEEVDIRFIAPNSLGYQEKTRGEPNIEVLRDLIRKIKEFNVRIFMGTFPSEVRPEYITEDVVHLFSQVDNKQISVGFQSGSERILQEMRRGHTVEAGLTAFELLSDHGYIPIFDFILGNPNETEADQWATLTLIRDLGSKARARLHYFMPLPGTPWATELPTPLYPDISSEIGRLARDELISGDFDRQLRFIKD